MKFNKAKEGSGFSLLELLVVIAILGILAAYLLTDTSRLDAPDRVIQDAAARMRERRAAAIRLSPLTVASSLENYSQPSVSIDFSNLGTTAPLVTDGASQTSYDAAANRWNYVYGGSSMIVPSGWRVCMSTNDLGSIPQISQSTLTSSVAFDSKGRPQPQPSIGGASQESGFYSVYFTDGVNARAVAVHSSGLVEVWRWDAGASLWKGFGDRQFGQ